MGTKIGINRYSESQNFNVQQAHHGINCSNNPLPGLNDNGTIYKRVTFCTVRTIEERLKAKFRFLPNRFRFLFLEDVP